MTTEIATRDDPRTPALLKAVGLDRLAPEQRDLAMNIAERYDLDLLLKHLVMIEGRAYITRDGLLHIAHRSRVLDGIETTEPAIVDDFWRASCSVYRKDMSRPFTYSGRYPTKGGNQKFAPEMAVKVAEVAALRRAFDVSAPTAEERWDLEGADIPEPPAKVTLAERVAEKAAVVEGRPMIVGEAGPERVLPPPDPRLVGTEYKNLRPDKVGLTESELKHLVEHTGTKRAVVASTAKRLFPAATSSADLTDEQRETLWDVIALEADAAIAGA
jgi:hypothetical protein